MNYPVRDALLKFLGGNDSACDFADSVKGLLGRYQRENVYAMYVPLGSHDTERLMSILGGDHEKARLAFLFQFAYPGAPAIYYGDEIGMQGGKDPDCRRAFPWQRGNGDEELRAWVKRLISLRKRNSCLRRGDYQQIHLDKKRCTYAFARTLGDEVVLVAMNASASKRHLRLPVNSLGWSDGRILSNLLGTEEFIVSGNELVVTLQPWQGVWIG